MCRLKASTFHEKKKKPASILTSLQYLCGFRWVCLCRGRNRRVTSYFIVFSVARGECFTWDRSPMEPSPGFLVWIKSCFFISRRYISPYLTIRKIIFIYIVIFLLPANPCFPSRAGHTIPQIFKSIISYCYRLYRTTICASSILYPSFMISIFYL